MVETLAPVSGKKPVVGLAGFFGYGNYGDELFVSVYKEYLSDKFDLRFMSDLPTKPYFSKPLEDIVDEVDAIVIGGGDIIQSWNIDPRYFMRALLKKPVFIIGVGVPIRKFNPANPNHYEKDWIVKKLHEFFSHPSVKMIHGRDTQTTDWIEKKLMPAIDVIEAPDIVCALTLPPVKKPEGAPILGIVTRQRPGKEDDYTQINALAEQQRGRGWKIRHLILGTGDVGVKDIKNADGITGEKELVVTESLEDLSRSIGECTALVSMKFHGTVVATMYGVPSTVLIPTNKNRNFMKRINREELISNFADKTLCERFDTPPEPISAASVAMLRMRAKAVMQQLEEEILKAL